MLRHPVSALEAYDWVDTTSLSQLVADFARVHMLVSLFDGDPQKWIEFLDQNGTVEERRTEMPVAQAFRRRVMTDPGYVTRLRDAVRQFSVLVEAVSADGFRRIPPGETPGGCGRERPHS